MRRTQKHARPWLHTWVLALLLIPLVVAPLVLADDTEEMHSLRYSDEGRLALVAGGVGLMASATGDIQLHVPGTEIKAAYLYWSGQDLETGGDNTISLTRDGMVMADVVAAPDGTYGPIFWWDKYYYFAYVADVTEMVELGDHTYTISDFGEAMFRRDGAGLLVVYEDLSLAYNQVEIWDGLDRFYRGWGAGPRGETAVNCFDFDAKPADRQIGIALFLGEIYRGGSTRPNALWYMTGTELDPKPVDMVNAPSDGPQIGTLVQGPPDSPFRSVDGYQWDTYTESVNIPAGDTWACFQVESARYRQYQSASGAWLVTGGSVRIQMPPTDTPTPTATPTYTPTPTHTPTPTLTPTPCPTPEPPPWPPVCLPLTLIALILLLILLIILAWLFLRRDRDEEEPEPPPPAVD